METKSTHCNHIVDTYRNQLLTDAEINTVSSKIFQYYTHRLKKSNTCIFCKQAKSRNEFLSKYNQKTFCRTLRIKCMHPTNPCKGWVYEYGVRFNLYKYVNDVASRIDAIKTQIIINKNNLLYGYTSVKNSKQYHDKFIQDITIETEIYKETLHDLLYYIENTELDNELNTLHSKIREKIQEIKQYVGQSNFKEGSNMHNDILELYACINKLNSFIRSVETEQLIRLDKSKSSTEYVDDHEDNIQEEIKPPKSREPRKTTPRKTSSRKTSATIPVKEKDMGAHDDVINDIEDIINNVKLIMLKDVAVIKSDTALKDDLEVYMSVLKDDISKGTPEQKTEYASLLSKYETFKSIDKPDVKISDKIEEIADLINLVKLLLKDDYAMLKTDAGAKEDLEVYMSVLKDDISKGDPEQQKEYKTILAKYEKFTSVQSSNVSVVDPASKYLDAIEL